MYCIKCGVKLADTEKQCPLCGTTVYHPDIAQKDAEPFYPVQHYPAPQLGPKAAQIIMTALFLLPLLVSVLCDLQVNRSVTWSGFVAGALVVSYVMLVLPYWFRNPNPVIFVPCSFAAIALFVLYIELATGGKWFLSFAFPVIGFFGLIITAVVTLLRYVRRGALYILGGAFVALGLFMPLMEFLITVTFIGISFTAWSLYPLIALVLLGGTLIFLAIHRPSRETMERKFFI